MPVAQYYLVHKELGWNKCAENHGEVHEGDRAPGMLQETQNPYNKGF